jgi:NADH-ubiquinone oxidoreductase chain 5
MLLLLTAFTKRAQYPFCNWLPLAIAAPTPVSSLVHRSTLVTAGMFLVFRYFFLFENYQFLLLLFLGGLFTSFVAGICSL